MKTPERKLLESAAKAAGYECAWSDSRQGFYFGLGSYTPQYWNPLSNDGDALRLAVKLRISLIHEQEYMGAPVVETIEATGPLRPDGSRHCEMLSLNSSGDDPMANTRRAIVRAAAAMAG